jgi:hypothetical protein
VTDRQRDRLTEREKQRDSKRERETKRQQERERADNKNPGQSCVARITLYKNTIKKV